MDLNKRLVGGELACAKKVQSDGPMEGIFGRFGREQW